MKKAHYHIKVSLAAVDTFATVAERIHELGKRFPSYYKRILNI
jgi:hypothetical protein